MFHLEDWLRFIELKSFSRKWEKLGLDDDTLRRLQIAIMLGPQRYPVMEGTGGLRKIRFSDDKSNKGKSGANRCCYVYFTGYSVFFIAVFGKNEKADLTPAEANAAAALIREIKAQLDTGVIR